MSELSNLVHNLNKIMEEYAEWEEEVVHTTQAETMQEGERVESRAEVEQPVEETRKRKREGEEAGVESSGEKASDWVLKQAYVAWRDKLQQRELIGERGFSNLISPFQEVIESKGWHLFCEHKAPGFVDVVKEFYANMVGIKEQMDFLQQRADRPNLQSS